MQQVRLASRRKYTPEEKVRIVLEGFRREVAVNELCRREGIKPGAYYAWTKDFMEAGKERCVVNQRNGTLFEPNTLV
jgi:transposase